MVANLVPQGGASSKLVRLGDTYGDLPIPTKAGYSFVGWKFNDEYITSTTQNVTTVEHTLTAAWGHDLKVDYNNGTLSNSLSPTYAGEVGTTTSVPSATPTKSGYYFGGWHYGRNLIEPTTFTGSNYIALGRDQMFTDKFTVVVRAYMDDWTEMSTKRYRLLSCTENGGWGLSSSNADGYLYFSAWDASKSNYTACKTTLANFSSGYHTVIGTFDGSYLRLYVDGKFVATSSKFSSSSISYNSTNSIFVGAEAKASITVPDDTIPYFIGTIDYVSIENSVATGTGAYTYPETYGDNLITPTTFTGSNFLTLGRQYMYSDKISITVRASMDNWSEFATGAMRLIGCAQDSGGWNFEPDFNGTGATNKYLRFAVYDSGANYKHVNFSVPLASLSKGYHTFTATFDGAYARTYLDGRLVGTSANFSNKIGYNSGNCIFVAAEAGSNTTTPESGHYFKGKIDYVAIENSVLSSTADYIYQDYDVVATAICN